MGRSAEHWTGVHRRARRVVTAGWITGAVGTAVFGVGAATRSPEILLVGLAGSTVGPPLIAGGSMRSAKAVEGLGGAPSRAPGIAAWSTWGAGMLLTWSSSSALPQDDPAYWPLQAGGLACHLSSFVFGGLQSVSNQRHLQDVAVTVAPLPVGGGGPGLVVSLQR